MVNTSRPSRLLRFFDEPGRLIAIEASRSSASESLAIPLLFLALQVATGFAFADRFVFGISLHWLDLIAGLTAVATFVMVNLLRPKRRAESQRRGWLLWVMAGLISSVVPQIVFDLIGGSISLELLELLPNGFVSYTVAMVALGLVVSSRLTSRVRLRELADDRSRLIALRDSLDEDIATMHSEMSTLVESRLSEAFGSLNLHLPATDSDSLRAASTKLRDVIDLVIRPLSVQLASNAELENKRAGSFANNDRSQTVTSPDRAIREAARMKLSWGQLLSPALFFVTVAVTIVPAFFYVYSVGGLLVSGISLVGVTALQVFARKLLRTRNARAVVALPAVILGVSAISFVIAAIVALLFDKSFNPIEVTYAMGASITLIVLFLYFSARRLNAISESEKVNASINDLLARMRQEVWVARQQMARLVHGQVQSRLLAAAMRLSQSEHPSPEQIQLAQADVVAAVNAISAAGAEVSEPFETQFTRIVDAWDGVCVISLETSDATINLLDDDPVARTCIAEIIGEAVANAAKHSQAARVEIALKTVGPDVIEVTSLTSGTPLGVSITNGFGSRMLDEVTIEWARTQVHGSVELHALVALAPKAS